LALLESRASATGDAVGARVLSAASTLITVAETPAASSSLWTLSWVWVSANAAPSAATSPSKSATSRVRRYSRTKSSSSWSRRRWASDRRRRAGVATGKFVGL